MFGVFETFLHLAGGELFDLIVERGHLTERDAAVKARALLEVIQHCHSRCGAGVPGCVVVDSALDFAAFLSQHQARG